jgi:hypothetical protein
MEQIFKYKPKVAVSEFYPVIVCGAAAAACGYFQYGIRFKNLRLLEYPYSMYVFGALALILLVVALNKLIKANKQNQPIRVGESAFSFPYKGGRAELAFSEIESVDRQSSIDDDFLVVRANGRDYKFLEDHFENEARYAAFIGLIEKR